VLIEKIAGPIEVLFRGNFWGPQSIRLGSRSLRDEAEEGGEHFCITESWNIQTHLVGMCRMVNAKM